MMGLGIFSALLVLSTVLNMHAVKYILQNFYQIGLIAVVIVFQPELRAALEKVGNSPIRGFRGLVSDTGEAEAVSADVEAICEAVCDMARSKTGALIVIERQTKLGDVMKTGVMINAQISSFLLRNIFFNNAPLHDGAVIIRSHHICAAGCFLPLSTTDDIVRDLGTRHRAAIGMSEASDAIVVVVSEETGTISTAINGTLKRNYNYNLLRQELLQLLVHTTHHLPRSKNADTEK
jgi:diadenylate cyclase